MRYEFFPPTSEENPGVYRDPEYPSFYSTPPLPNKTPTSTGSPYIRILRVLAGEPIDEVYPEDEPPSRVPILTYDRYGSYLDGQPLNSNDVPKIVRELKKYPEYQISTATRYRYKIPYKPKTIMEFFKNDES